MISDLVAARGMLSLVSELRKFFRHQVTLEQAREDIKRGLDQREQAFLDLARAQIYERGDGVYFRLLRMAGCDFADLQSHVRHNGLEDTLQKLAEEGVYLTSDEFRGKKELVRGGRSFPVSPIDFKMPDSDHGLMLTQSSGSRHKAHRYAFSLDRVSMLSRSTCVFFSAHDLFHHAHGIYDAILPTSGGIRYLLTFAKFGIKVDRWFARQVPMNSWPEASFHRLVTSLIVLATNSFGPGAPWPEFLEEQEIRRIVHWIVERNRQGTACCLRTTASNAVRIARAAGEMGQQLDGARFIVSGEPLTDAKRASIERVNARAIPCYGCSGLGQVGYGCGNPGDTDDVHIPSHGLALIQHRAPFDSHGASIHPFLFTTLSPFYPLLQLNVANGDYGVLQTRNCGCALESAGLKLHLHHIRSYEKLTGEGMSYYYGDLYELLERILPGEFGGGPGDYQLVEEEDSAGQTRLSLVVHPQVEHLDETKLYARLRTALSTGSRNNQFMTKIWESAGTFRIKRGVPYSSARGKVLPLHIGLKQAEPPS
ncbi:MAG: hypothetical protein ACREQ7_05365 [Candidatus Binatia bacterium]